MTMQAWSPDPGGANYGLFRAYALPQACNYIIILFRRKDLHRLAERRILTDIAREDDIRSLREFALLTCLPYRDAGSDLTQNIGTSDSERLRSYIAGCNSALGDDKCRRHRKSSYQRLNRIGNSDRKSEFILLITGIRRDQRPGGVTANCLSAADALFFSGKAAFYFLFKRLLIPDQRRIQLDKFDIRELLQLLELSRCFVGVRT